MEHATMAFKCFDRPFEIGRYEAVPLPQARGARVRSLRGALWITQEGDREDHVVCPGGSFTVERDGVTLVSAPHGPGTVLVTRPAPQHKGAFLRWLAIARDYLLHSRRSSWTDCTQR